jgi:ferric-dicitrate binding protein FerR (iron transport regulator)
MSQERDDERLREEFRRLRSDTGESGRIPEFAAMIAKARADAVAPRLDVADGGARSRERTPRRRTLLVGGWATAAVAAAVAGLLLIGRGPDADEEFDRIVASYAADASTGAWRSPTAALLDVPGIGLTRSMPSVGGSARGLDPTARPPRPDGRDS